MRLYGALDVAFAALYAWIGFVLAPAHWLPFSVGLAFTCVLLAVGGLGLVFHQRWARPAAIAASIVLLVFAALVILGLVASSAYLRGIYGALGQGMAVMALIVAALVIELFALLPLFQLRFLLGRRD